MAELGSGNGTSYPASLDVDNTVEVDGSTTARADVPNDLAAAIIGVQTELGTDPAGALTDVKTYLQTEHNTNGTHSSITATNLTLTGELILAKGADVASANDLNVTGVGNYFDVTGTTTINTIQSKGVGSYITLHFDGACQLTHDATNLVIPSGANHTTAAGDEYTFFEYASADWRMVSYALATGKAITPTATVPSASLTTEGIVEVATQAEVDAGSDTLRTVSPSTLASWSKRGRIKQVVSTNTSAVATTTTQIPGDDTAPTSSEGAELMTVAITPTSASSVLHVHVNGYVAVPSDGYQAALALLKDSATDSIAAGSGNPNQGGNACHIVLQHSLSAASTSAQTFRVRFGMRESGTATANGQSGSRVFGTTTKSNITIYEVL